MLIFHQARGLVPALRVQATYGRPTIHSVNQRSTYDLGFSYCQGVLASNSVRQTDAHGFCRPNLDPLFSYWGNYREKKMPMHGLFARTLELCLGKET